MRVLTQTVNVLRYYCTNVSQRQADLMARGLPKRAPISGVDNVVVIASGKGGVGKSTTSVNIAVCLAQMGQRVGLLDADVFGPSIPLMMNLSGSPLVNERNMMIPLQNYGVKCLSMGFLVDPNKPIVWRGPMVMSALQKLLKNTDWGSLDILLVDTPPGTGDIHLSLAQNIPITGTILVSTPQKAALDVAKRGAEMYEILKVPIIGIVENMSHIICNNCNEKIEIYPQRIAQLAAEMGVEVLDSVPINPQVSECSDSGVPIVIKAPDSVQSRSYGNISTKLLRFLELNQASSANK